MKYQTVRHSVLLVVLALFVAGFSPASAQFATYNLTFNVTVTYGNEQGEDLEREVMEMLRTELQAKGAVEAEEPDMVFLTRAVPLEESGQIALSVVTLYSLPEAVVQMGKQDQVAYRNVSDEERAAFSEEGKHVREYMSEEFTRQFAMVQGQDLMVVEEDALEEAVAEIVERFFARYTRR